MDPLIVAQLAAPVSFEMVGPDRYLLKNDGIFTGEELADREYMGYVQDRRSGHKGIDLVPESYRTFMKYAKGPGDYPFDMNAWETRVAPHLSAEIRDSLYHFQREAVYRMIQMRRCMNAASPGLGKTIQGIACLAYFRALKKSSKCDVILCPSYLKTNWVSELRMWLPEQADDVTEIVHAAPKYQAANMKALTGTGIVVISYDTLARVLERGCMRSTKLFETLVCDESHYIKGNDSRRYATLAPFLRGAQNVFLLTGTPSPNRNRELFTQFAVLQPAVFTEYFRFALRYCDGHRDAFGRFEDKGATCTQELAFLMSRIAMRMRREDHLDELPEVTRERVDLELTTGLSENFREMRAKFVQALRELKTNPKAKFKAQLLSTRLFQETARVKWPAVVDYLRTRFLEQSHVVPLEKTIVFCKHRTMFNAVVNFFSTEMPAHGRVAISGATPIRLRSELIRTFREDPECMFAILTTGSCSTGLNITPIRKMIFAEMDWSPSVLDQCEARIKRIHGAKCLQYTYLVCTGTMDNTVFRKLQNKTLVATLVVDGGRDYGDFQFI